MNKKTELFSHFGPQLRLQAHLAQVGRAAEFLLASHSQRVRLRRPQTERLLDALVRCHDLGKASPAFQDYIRDPSNYNGGHRAKEHSALSAALAILWARAQQWPALEILALAQAVAGHHAGFATLDYLWDCRLRPQSGDALLEQWRELDRVGLEQATGLDLAGLEGEFGDAARWLFRREKVAKQLQALELNEAVGFRLWTQFLFSLLLEADKAFLALREEKLKLYLHSERPQLSAGWVDDYLAAKPDTPLNPLRREIRTRVLGAIDNDKRCCTLTLPTGVGKTMLAASWALALRERMMLANDGIAPKIIIVLPYLSIIDQTEQEYRRLLRLPPEGNQQSEWLMASHSLSQRQYELESQSRALGRQYTNFYLDTWRSEVVLTTFDQLLLALFSGRSRHLMRFHALFDALIVLDEVQTLPCRLWDLLDHALRALCAEGNSRILMMSATQPALLSNAVELAGEPAQVTAVFDRFSRYRIHFRQSQPFTLDAFIAELIGRLPVWLEAEYKVLITLNTRASAKTVWRALDEELQALIPVYLISADVTPQDRLKKITAIKQDEPCLVVSTQTVEAGVDIDMHVAIRDFAPLDSLIQIAGRCNRNNRLGQHGGVVEVVSLLSGRGRPYAEMIYDAELLGATADVVESLDNIGEEQVLALSRRYFALLKQRKNTGADITRAFAHWQEFPDIRELLRGESSEQHSLLVLDEVDDADLRAQIEQALQIEDRWQQRDQLRILAPELQKRTVNIYARAGFHPEDYADELKPFWLLRSRYYDSDSGLDLQLDEEHPACIL